MRNSGGQGSGETDTGGTSAAGIAAGRLNAEAYRENFADLHPPLSAHEASVEADRCYFCYDAPCMNACPTEIDIAMFIREIAAENPLGAARTIFDQNILGGMCARVCPTETLCEEACVREEAEGKPVRIGRLQRYATDTAMQLGTQFYKRAPATGRTIAIVGAGPAGLACAHRLAVHGHSVTIFDEREKPGGLNEYGIASYKTPDDFARKEVDYILAIGGIKLSNGQKLGRDFTLETLKAGHDAVFLGIGLAGVNDLRAEGEDIAGIEDAIDFIARLRQSENVATIPIGRHVVVIGGGMTAIDAAIQAKLLGAETVTLCYRRGREHMNASSYEQELAASNGVAMRFWLRPARINAENGHATSIDLEYTALKEDNLVGTGHIMTLAADQIFKAIGQTYGGEDDAPVMLEAGRIKIDPHFRTSDIKVWAGGDCVAGGDDLTVTAVANGRDAAEAIHKTLMEQEA